MKTSSQASQTSKIQTEEDASAEAALRVLNDVPDIRMLLTNVVGFADKMSLEDGSERSLEGQLLLHPLNGSWQCTDNEQNCS